MTTFESCGEVACRSTASRTGTGKYPGIWDRSWCAPSGEVPLSGFSEHEERRSRQNQSVSSVAVPPRCFFRALLAGSLGATECRRHTGGERGSSGSRVCGANGCWSRRWGVGPYNARRPTTLLPQKHMSNVPQDPALNDAHFRRPRSRSSRRLFGTRTGQASVAIWLASCSPTARSQSGRLHNGRNGHGSKEHTQHVDQVNARLLGRGGECDDQMHEERSRPHEL